MYMALYKANQLEGILDLVILHSTCKCIFLALFVFFVFVFVLFFFFVFVLFCFFVFVFK